MLMDMCLHKFDIYQGISAETLDVLIFFEKKSFVTRLPGSIFSKIYFSPAERRGVN